MAYSKLSIRDDDQKQADEFWGSYGLREDGLFIICFFGSINRYFDFSTIIDSAREIQKRDESVRFAICGDGPDIGRLQAASSDCKNISWPGWVDSPKIDSLMKISSIGIAPYKPHANFLKNLTNKPVEYMSYGLPVLSSIGGVLGRELQTNDCGIVYDQENLSKCIMSLRNDKRKLHGMSSNAKSLFYAKYNADNVYSELAGCLQHILKWKSAEIKSGPSVQEPTT